MAKFFPEKGFRPWLVAGFILMIGLIFLVLFGRRGRQSLMPATALRDLNLSPKAGILVDSLQRDFVDVGVANRDEDPMLSEIAEHTEALDVEGDEPFVLPWFYYSPLVPRLSPTSYANQAPLLEREVLNEFTWHEDDQGMLLKQSEKNFTGFHATDFDGWYFFDQGRQTDLHISSAQGQALIIQRNMLARLMPSRRHWYFFMEPPGSYNAAVDIRPVEYPILYRATDQMILTAPPGTKGSAFVATTEDFFEIPMEVVGEVETFNGTWLHVYIGYDELGWIEKDPSYTDYVRTYYSERDLLDTVVDIMEEEILAMNAVVGASFVNNETMAQISYNNQNFFPASTQKIYVLGELYHQYKTGKLDPYESYMTLTHADKVPGAGIIQGYPEGSVFSMNDLVNLVVVHSDNTAANLLIDAVGGGYTINPHMQQLGLYDTYTNGKYYDGDNAWFTTTPYDAARFFALLYNNQVNGEPYDSLLIDKLRMNYHTYIRTYIWGDTVSWNKSGIGETEQNDVATFVTPYGSYSLAVYTAYPWNRDLVAEQMAYLSVRIHEAFNEERGWLWVSYQE